MPIDDMTSSAVMSSTSPRVRSGPRRNGTDIGQSVRADCRWRGRPRHRAASFRPRQRRALVKLGRPLWVAGSSARPQPTSCRSSGRGAASASRLVSSLVISVVVKLTFLLRRLREAGGRARCARLSVHSVLPDLGHDVAGHMGTRAHRRLSPSKLCRAARTRGSMARPSHPPTDDAAVVELGWAAAASRGVARIALSLADHA